MKREVLRGRMDSDRGGEIAMSEKEGGDFHVVAEPLMSTMFSGRGVRETGGERSGRNAFGGDRRACVPGVDPSAEYKRKARPARRAGRSGRYTCMFMMSL